MDFYDILFAKKLSGGGGSSVDVESLSVTENGTYTAEEGKAYSPVNVNVPVGWTTDGIGQNLEPNGGIVYTATSIGQYAFAGKPITSFVAPNATTYTGLYWFPKCPNLTSVSLPLMKEFSINMNNSAYGAIPLLNKLYVPKVEKLLSQSLCVLPSLVAVAFPSIKTIDLNGLQTTGSGITTVDFGKGLTEFKNSNAPNNNTLVNIILRKDDGVVPCTNVGGLANRLVNYYIPKVLYDHLGDGTALDYQSASNWSTRYASGYCNFVQIEGTQYENYWADGEPIV